MSKKQVIDITNTNILTIDETSTINEALQKIKLSSQNEIVVLCEDERFRYGILNSNDFIKLKLQKVDFQTPIKEIFFNKLNTINEKRDYLDILEEIDSQNSSICVVDDKHELKGLVSYFEIITNIKLEDKNRDKPLSQVLLSLYLKNIKMTTPTIDVIKMMKDVVNESILIHDSNQKAVGTITSKDIVKLLINNEDLDQPISKYMSTPIKTIKHDATIFEVLEFIKNNKTKYIFIEDDEENILGQITQDEILSKIYSRLENHTDDEPKKDQLNSFLQRKSSIFEQLSTIDLLTGLYNKSKIEKELDKEMERVKRYGENSFSLVFMDIDNFKKINDTYGHNVGDTILQELSLKVQKHLRKSDIIGRWGADEFLIILPVTGIENAKLAVKNIQDLLKTIVFKEMASITCSFGLSQFKPSSDSLHSVTLRADKALQNAKDSGFNSIFLAYE